MRDADSLGAGGRRRTTGAGVAALAVGAVLAPITAPLLTPGPTEAQALPFHTSTGITAGFNENAARHFVSFVGRSGLMRDGEPTADPMDREVRGLLLANGVIVGALTPLWTFRVLVPWVRKEMYFTPAGSARRRFRTSGIGDVSLQTKWIFFRRDRPAATTRLGVQGRMTAPLGDTDARLPSGEAAPRALQVGTGTWDVGPELLFTHIEGRWGVHGNVGWRLPGRDEGFQPGDALTYDVAVALRLVPRVYESLRDRSLVAYAELNGEVAGRDRVGGREVAETGGHLLHFSPALQWIPTPWLLLETSLQLPVVQELNGAQLGHVPRFHFGTRYRFSVLR